MTETKVECFSAQILWWETRGCSCYIRHSTREPVGCSLNMWSLAFIFTKGHVICTITCHFTIPSCHSCLLIVACWLCPSSLPYIHFFSLPFFIFCSFMLCVEFYLLLLYGFWQNLEYDQILIVTFTYSLSSSVQTWSIIQGDVIYKENIRYWAKSGYIRTRQRCPHSSQQSHER